MEFISKENLESEVNLLRVEKDALREELQQCQADKEFVWSLWKQLQVTSPDLTKTISFVMRKEKEKAEMKDRKILKMLQGSRVEELQRLVNTQSQDLSLVIAKKNELQEEVERWKRKQDEQTGKEKLLNQKICELESRISDQQLISRESLKNEEQKVDEFREKLRVHKETITTLENDKRDLTTIREAQRDRIATLEANVEQYKESCDKLKQQIEEKQGKHEEKKRCLSQKQHELEAVRSELSELWETHQQTVAHSNEQRQLIDQLQALQTDTQKVLKTQDKNRNMENISMQQQMKELTTKYQLLQNSEQELKVWINQYKQRISLQERQIAELKYQLEKVNTRKPSTAAQVLLNTKLNSLQHQSADDISQHHALEKPISTSSPLDAQSRTRSHLDRARSRSNDRQDHGSGSRVSRVHHSRAHKGRSRSCEQGIRRSGVNNAERRLLFSSDDESDPSNHDAMADKLNKVLQELRDTQTQLEIKTTEVLTLRGAHARRLERLKSLQKSHSLVKKELKLADEDNRSTRKTKKPLPRSDPRSLQREDSDGVWNELTHFKSQAKNLSVENMNLSEELDRMRVQQTADATAIYELMNCLYQERDDLEQLCAEQEECNSAYDAHLIADLKQATDNILRLESQLSDLRVKHHKVKDELSHVGKQKEQLLMDKDCLVAEKDRALMDARRLQGELSTAISQLAEKRSHILRLEQQLVATQAEVRRRKATSTAKKMSAAKQYQRILNKSISTMSGIFDEFQSEGWEEVTGDSTELSKSTDDTIVDACNTASSTGASTHASVTASTQASMTASTHASTDATSLGSAIVQRARTQQSDQYTASKPHQRSQYYDDDIDGRMTDSVTSRLRLRDAASSPINLPAYAAHTDHTAPPTGGTARTRDGEYQCTSGTESTAPSVAAYSTSTVRGSMRGGKATSRSSMLGYRTAVGKSGTHVRTLKQRCSYLQRKISIYRAARDAAHKRDIENKELIEHLQSDLQLANQRLQNSKSTNQRLASDLSRIRMDKESLECRIRDLEENTVTTDSHGAHTEQEWNHSNAKIKNLTQELSRQAALIKQLKSDNNNASDRVAQLQEKINHQDRDLSQKRALVEDVRLKLRIAQENAQSDADVMLDAEKKIESLADTNFRMKKQIESFRKRLTAITKDKQAANMTAMKLTTDLDRKTKTISELQAKNRSLSASITRLEASAQTQLHAVASHSEAAIDTAQQQLQRINMCNQEYYKFVKMLSHTVVTSIQQARILLRQQTSKKAARERECHDQPESLKQARQKACEILNMSGTDIDDLMSDKQPLSEEQDLVLNAELRNDKRWARKWEKLLLQNKDSFAVTLVDILMEKINERVDVGQQLYNL